MKIKLKDRLYKKEIMEYKNTKIGTFLSRPNRFIALVMVDGVVETAHVKNTGRCKELLAEGVQVILQEFFSEKRKTRYDVIAVYKGDRLINIDSQVPNGVVRQWIEVGNYFKNISYIKAESVYGSSRFDFYLEADNKKIFVEVKGVTLEQDGVVKFPDAPTERGLKHVNELCLAVQEGYAAYIIFVVQMKGVRYFTPNSETQPQFALALKTAVEKGVKLLAFDCTVTENSIEAGQSVPILL